MSELSVFDIAGPIMIGPSSSHTAGACKIGQFARALFHKTPQKVTFYLHGSFGEVYKGHATDRALLGGVMKFRTSDPRIECAFKVAEEKKIKYKFIKKDLGAKYHPNTVQIVLENKAYKMSIIGSSIGGGMIEIVKIDDFDINLKGRVGKYQSLVVCHDKDSQLLTNIIGRIKKMSIGVAEVESTSFRKKTLSIISLEGRRILLKEVVELEKIGGIEFVRALSKLDK
ncbi:L-serine ammonia-lyase, iron-sulfur-dependent subunit beta [Patescibacteria group bacterium]|nr:L-serine ammonia-lyase, iron-sulfur-dependent subunit beta [Patescibacteria group bacterium]